MKIAVAAPTYGRLDVLERCLNSLASNTEVLEGAPVYLYPDAVSDAELAEQKRLLHSSIFNGCVMDRPAERLGNYLNSFRALRETFELPERYDYVFRTDSDLVFSRDAVRVLARMSEWSKAYIISTIVCHLSKEDKKKYSGVIMRGFHTGTNGMFSRAVWEAVDPVIGEYESEFVSKRSLHNPVKWIRDRILSKPELNISPWDLQTYQAGAFGTTADGVLKFAMDYLDIPYATTFVNRAIHPSPDGECAPDNPNVWILISQKLDEIESDSHLTEFKWSKDSFWK